MRRRDFITLLGGSIASIAAKPHDSLGASVRPSLRVDVHCHLFNGRDLPVYGLLESVFLEQNIFGIFAEPLALWLATSVEGNAPTFEQEMSDLDQLIEYPAVIAKRKPNSDRIAEILERGLKEFIDDYTSFGRPKTSITDRNDAFLLELLRRFAPSSALKENMTKEDVLGLLNEQKFRQDLIERILNYSTNKSTLGVSDEFSDYISQFSHWVGTFTEYHSQLADDLSAKFGEDLGNQPSNNVKLPNSSFPDELVKLCKDKPGQAIDKVLTKIYEYCDRNALAIMAHCGNTIGSRPGYALRSAPELWRPVLDHYRRLRLNLGHFGGIWDYFLDPECRDSTDTNWPTKIGAMINDYDNLFVDVADFSGVLDRWDSEKCATKDIFANLTKLIRNRPKLRSRMMYGSDWMLLDREPKNDEYYDKMKRYFSDLLGVADVDGFLGQNAATYLGLRSGQPTRKRIDKFYRDAHQPPPDFDRYLSS
jgi:hypothetical protein